MKLFRPLLKFVQLSIGYKDLYSEILANIAAHEN